MKQSRLALYLQLCISRKYTLTRYCSSVFLKLSYMLQTEFTFLNCLIHVNIKHTNVNLYNRSHQPPAPATTQSGPSSKRKNVYILKVACCFDKGTNGCFIFKSSCCLPNSLSLHPPPNLTGFDNACIGHKHGQCKVILELKPKKVGDPCSIARQFAISFPE